MTTVLPTIGIPITPLPSALSIATLTLRGGAAVIFDGAATVGSLRMDNYAGLYPIESSPATLILTVTGDASLTNSSRIDVFGRGYIAATGPGAGAAGATSPDNRAAGGSYGGNGGRGGINYTGVSVAYGSLTEPSDFGSGGGNYGGNYGGNGGGGIRLLVGGTLLVDSNSYLTANGTDSSNNAGGGAGGSLWITAGTLAGVGQIVANGGYGNGYGGGGAGGRIAIYYNTNNFGGTLTALGGGTNGNDRIGGAGTIYLKSSTASTGDLILDQGRGAYYETITPVTIPANVSIHNLIVRSGATAAFANRVTIDNLTLTNYARFFSSGSASTVNVSVRGDAAITNNARIEVSGGGYAATFGPGSGATGNSASDKRGGGGGHGGKGGNGYQFPNSGGSVNDSEQQPIDLGSGGGNSVYYSGSGGAGGGAVRLLVNGILTLQDSQILANGADSTNYGGGGAGGSIWITSNVFTGNGTISANGGVGNGYGGGGGGGRIAVYTVDSTSFTGADHGQWGRLSCRSGLYWHNLSADRQRSLRARQHHAFSGQCGGRADGDGYCEIDRARSRWRPACQPFQQQHRRGGRPPVRHNQ